MADRSGKAAEQKIGSEAELEAGLQAGEVLVRRYLREELARAALDTPPVPLLPASRTVPELAAMIPSHERPGAAEAAQSAFGGKTAALNAAQRRAGLRELVSSLALAAALLAAFPLALSRAPLPVVGEHISHAVQSGFVHKLSIDLNNSLQVVLQETKLYLTRSRSGSGND